MRRNRVITLLAVLASVCALAVLAALIYLASIISVDGPHPEFQATMAFIETNNARVSTAIAATLMAIAATQTARAQ